MMTGHVGVRHGKRGDSWFYKIPLGRNPVTGKKKDEKRRGYATRAEAKAVMDLRISALMQERAMKHIQSFMPMMPAMVAPASLTPPSPLNPMTVAELLHKWLNESIAITGKGTTPDTFRKVAEGVIIPVFGHMYLHELQHDHIQEWIKVMMAVKGGAMMDHRGGEKLYHLAPLCSIKSVLTAEGKCQVQTYSAAARRLF